LSLNLVHRWLRLADFYWPGRRLHSLMRHGMNMGNINNSGTTGSAASSS
jgi:hypothetical protein